jgi:hypothetical protein
MSSVQGSTLQFWATVPFIYNRFHNRELMLKFSKNAHLHRIKNYTYNLYNSEDYNALDEAAWQN